MDPNDTAQVMLCPDKVEEWRSSLWGPEWRHTSANRPQEGVPAARAPRLACGPTVRCPSLSCPDGSSLGACGASGAPGQGVCAWVDPSKVTESHLFFFALLWI